MPRRLHGLPLFLLLVIGVVVNPGRNIPSVQGLFDWGDDEEYEPQTVKDYGPVVLQSLLGLRYTALAQGSDETLLKAIASVGSAPAPETDILMDDTVVLPYGEDGEVVVRRDGLNALFVSFVGNGSEVLPNGWNNETKLVPWMDNFLYTAEAPIYLLDLFSDIPFESAVDDVMGNERVLWLTCTGDGEIAGGLAILCGLSGALYFPGAAVEVITFDKEWQGFNSQFSWAFDRLLAQYYLWPFSTSDVLGNVDVSTLFSQNTSLQLAANIQSLITQDDAIKSAINIPNLPPGLPDDFLALNEKNLEFPEGSYDELVDTCYDSYVSAGNTYGNTTQCFAGSPKVKDLRNLAPNENLTAPGKLPEPSSCPPILCRTRDMLDKSCTAFGVDGNQTTASSPTPASLEGLDWKLIEDKETSSDAIVAWNDTSKEAFFLWKFTNETGDWWTDAVAYKTDNFIKELKEQFPGAVPTLDTFDDPQVHRGFYGQYNALVVEGEGANNLTQALFDLNGGQDPLYISISGFSLGGALSELHAVWTALRWPEARITVATQGAPKVGNEDFVELFKALVGNVYRYQFNLDEVPAIPPLSGYRTTRNPIWITSEGGGPYHVLLSPRPEIGTSLTTWYDHWCEAFYVPLTEAAKTIDVPQWIFSYGR